MRRRSMVRILFGVVGLAAPLALAPVAFTSAAAADTAVSPAAAGMLDCNGLSPAQRPIKRTMVCADPRVGGGDEAAEDNGRYIGHDEPAVRFVSNKAGSSADVTWTERIGVDPSSKPTVAHPGSDITHYFELTIAPWFSMNLCDNYSTPFRQCTPQSDANAPHGSFPGGGAAFMELQFYAPGFAPFEDNISCDNKHWCSALTIDSLACTLNGRCNNNCFEPVNFAWIQTDGRPAGPPSPQLSNDATYTPNAKTLMINPGDQLRIHMFDAPVSGGHAFRVTEDDLTTGKSGSMTASAANGFMHTNPVSCKGVPFNFEPEYSTASAQNVLPWGSGPYNIDTEFEIGHFEACTSLAGFGRTPIEGGYQDSYATQCVGPYEKTADRPSSVEPDDAPCFAAGDDHGGLSAPNEVTGCPVFFDAIGDLDYDGSSYYPDWPNATTPDAFPSTFQQAQPTSRGTQYSQVQFVTDTTSTQSGCDPSTGDGCVLPPHGPGHFYPYWTQASVQGQCVWEFGNMTNGNTFGQDAQYGSVGPGTRGAFAGPVRTNPNC
jgi:hypothetical protein